MIKDGFIKVSNYAESSKTCQKLQTPVLNTLNPVLLIFISTVDTFVFLLNPLFWIILLQITTNEFSTWLRAKIFDFLLAVWFLQTALLLVKFEAPSRVLNADKKRGDQALILIAMQHKNFQLWTHNFFIPYLFNLMS